MFHASLLTPYVETDAHGPNGTRPPPDLADEKRYEIEKILKHRIRQKKLQLYIKWKGYPEDEATWEDEDTVIDDAEKMLQQYKATKINRPKRSKRRHL